MHSAKFADAPKTQIRAFDQSRNSSLSMSISSSSYQGGGALSCISSRFAPLTYPSGSREGDLSVIR
jgi:hypothetical protein